MTMLRVQWFLIKQKPIDHVIGAAVMLAFGRIVYAFFFVP